MTRKGFLIEEPGMTYLTEAGLEGAAATLMLEAMYHGVRCGVIHPRFTDTPMVRALGEQSGLRLIAPNWGATFVVESFGRLWSRQGFATEQEASASSAQNSPLTAELATMKPMA